MAMPAAKTYRTKGRNNTSGILLKGNVRELTGYRTATSIPSKFETILHTGNKEKDGFNGRAYRFSDGDNDLPGPGNYNILGDVQSDINNKSTLMKTGGSVSKRGCGAMISKNFAVGFTAAGVKAAVPGAGSYNVKGQFEDATKEDKCLFAGRTGPSYLSSQPTPGPGDYNSFKSSMVASELPGAKGAAFLSRAIRLDDKKKVGPAPGTYESGHIPQYAPEVPSSAFQSGSGRDKTANVFFEKQAKLPGPASYQETNAHKLTLHGKGTHMFTGQVAKGAFAFADQEIIEARLKEKYGGNPGPGAYFDEADKKTANPKKREPQPTGNFNSKSERISYMTVSENPGPSFYKTPATGKPLKKSYHLNTNGCWV